MNRSWRRRDIGRQHARCMRYLTRGNLLASRSKDYQPTRMKRFPLALCAIAILISAAQAGPDRYSSKETASVPPCPAWYADNEWNVSLWGAYAFTNNDYPTPGNTISQGIVLPINGV